MKKLVEALNNEEGNYILPLFWQHGEDETTLREYMCKIYESGIYAVCVEARPHPDFVGDKWWQDIDIIMDEARKRNMRVWVLDDAHFPTGYANGKILKDYPEYGKLYIDCKRIDVVGPMAGSSFLVEVAANGTFSLGETVGTRKKGKVIGVVAGKKVDEKPYIIDYDSMIDVSKFVDNGILYWDTPKGNWSIFVIVETTEGGEIATKDYLNPIVAEATKVLINEVYEAHYKHYKKDFGKTFAGFFSDEPRFGNVKGMFATMGKEMVLPWSKDMPKFLDEEFQGEFIKYLPLLWNEATDKVSMTRYIYMNVVSELYAKNFTDQIGTWCSNHEVEYIGHVIEDNNAHGRLGYGPGHYFRALRGQHMAGLDFVLGQIVPGLDKGYIPSRSAPGWDGEFFHYALGKMGSSLAHIDPKKKGRTMCEVFGAYGWVEGLKAMKWFTDHMLVRGVNWFCPHGFTPKEFPDRDCPPHLYANGFNPQHRYYKKLNDYTNRMAHLLNDGISVSSVGILYHAEAEWAGEVMLFQEPARELMQNQINFDILPVDIFDGKIKVKEGILKIERQSYEALVIPFAQYQPISFLSQCAELVKAGLKIVFIDSMPEGSCEGEDINNIIEILEESVNCSCVSLEKLTVKIKELNIKDIEVSDFQPYLRAYHYKQEDSDIFMFFNEDPYEDIETTIKISTKGNMIIYNALENEIKAFDAQECEDGCILPIHLTPYESIVFIANSGMKDLKFEETLELVETKEIVGNYKVSISKSKEYPKFTDYKLLDKLVNLARPNELPNFSGTVRYEINIDIQDIYKKMELDIGEAYETVQVFLNDRDLGVKLCKPYCYDITKYLVKGKNNLVFEVTNTLVKELKDVLSKSSIQEPTGLIGPINIKNYE